MNNKESTKSFKDFCPACIHFREESGVCKKFYFNVRDYPNKFPKECNGNHFSFDSSKDVENIDQFKARTESEMATETEQNVSYAGFWVRFASITVDGFLVGTICLFLLSIFVEIFHSMMSTETYLKFLLFNFAPFFFLATIFYIAWFDAENRHTLGKKLFGLAVVDTSLKPIPFSRSLLRALAHFIDIPGLWFILLSKKKQTVHDKIARTYVIRTRAPHRLEKLFIFGIFFLLVGDSFFNTGYIMTYIREKYVQAFRIPAGSMKPTVLVGDFVLFDKYWAINNLPKPGELILFKYPPDPSLAYIKRCIAVVGDTVEVENGTVYVNGEPEGEMFDLGNKYDPADGTYVHRTRIKSPYGKTYVVRHYVDKNVELDDYGPVVVPDDHYFMIGDNRDNSADSRVWGFLSQKNVTGKAGIIYFSWDRFSNRVNWSRIGLALK